MNEPTTKTIILFECMVRKKIILPFFPTSSSIVCGLMGNVHVTLVHDEVNGR